MPKYTVSQRKQGFPAVFKDGLPWLTLECPQKARQIADALNREPVEHRDRLVVENAADASGMNAVLDEILERQQQIKGNVGAILDEVCPEVRLQAVEANIHALTLRVATLEAQRQPSPWITRGSI